MVSDSYENQIGARLQAIIYDCKEPAELARFYAKLLGGKVEADPYGAYQVTVPTLGIQLGFQEDEHYTPPVWLGAAQDQQQMVHIDIHVENREKAVEYALSIGACMPEKQFCQQDWEIQWTTLLDPAGHPFCLWDA